MGNHLRSMLMGFLVMVVVMGVGTEGAVSVSSMKKITRVNKEGPYLGIVVPNSYEMDPLLQSPSFVADDKFPYLDFAGETIIRPHQNFFFFKFFYGVFLYFIIYWGLHGKWISLWLVGSGHFLVIIRIVFLQRGAFLFWLVDVVTLLCMLFGETA